jgi:hypothetical protein
MFLHSVFFWMKPGLTRDEATAFEKGLLSLCRNPPATSGYYGTPAGTDRAVVDNSYGYGLFLFFEDAAGQDVYQVGEVHQKFIADHAAKWERVLVYDIELS